MSLQIDDRLPLSDYPWCDFIHMGYFVHIIARTHGFYDDVVVKLPIIIQPRDVSEKNYLVCVKSCPLPSCP